MVRIRREISLCFFIRHRDSNANNWDMYYSSEKEMESDKRKHAVVVESIRESIRRCPYERRLLVRTVIQTTRTDSHLWAWVSSLSPGRLLHLLWH